jgi:hypothetical protein
MEDKIMTTVRHDSSLHDSVFHDFVFHDFVRQARKNKKNHPKQNHDYNQQTLPTLPILRHGCFIAMAIWADAALFDGRWPHSSVKPGKS